MKPISQSWRFLVLSLALVFALSACGSTITDTTGGSGSTPGSGSSTSTPGGSSSTPGSGGSSTTTPPSGGTFQVTSVSATVDAGDYHCANGTQTFTFTAASSNGANITATLQLVNNGTNLPPVTFTLP